MTILIIGLGSAARKHITAIREIDPETVIYALRSSRSGEDISEIRNIYSLNELTAPLDFIIISNPTSMHGQAIMKCLDLTCPLFIEKPVFDGAPDADMILELINQKQVISYIACNMRFHPAIQYCKEHLLVKNFRINEVNIYCGSYLPDWRPGKDFRTVYSANAAMGGGVHLDLIHELDYCTWLFGMPAELKTVKRNVSSLGIDAVDSAYFQLLYPSFTANIGLNYYRRDAKRQIEIVGQEDTFHIDLLANTVTSLVSKKCLYEAPFSINQTYVQQMRYFINHIKEHKQPMNSISEGVNVLKLALHG